MPRSDLWWSAHFWGFVTQPAHVFYMLLSFLFLFFFNLAKRSIQQCRGWHHLRAETRSHGTLHLSFSLSPATASISQSGNVGSRLRGQWSKVVTPMYPSAPLPHISKCPRQHDLHTGQCPPLSRGPCCPTTYLMARTSLRWRLGLSKRFSACSATGQNRTDDTITALQTQDVICIENIVWICRFLFFSIQ